MTIASDDAVEAIRDTEGLPEAILKCSSYSRSEQTRRWLRYPGEVLKYFWHSKKKKKVSASNGQEDPSAAETTEKVVQPFMQAAAIQNNLDGQVQRTANQVLAAIGYNLWVPKIPGQVSETFVDDKALSYTPLFILMLL